MIPTEMREAVKGALEYIVSNMDYDLAKSISDPEDDDATTWDEYADAFIVRANHTAAKEENND